VIEEELDQKASVFHGRGPKPRIELAQFGCFHPDHGCREGERWHPKSSDWWKHLRLIAIGAPSGAGHIPTPVQNRHSCAYNCRLWLGLKEIHFGLKPPRIHPIIRVKKAEVFTSRLLQCELSRCSSPSICFELKCSNSWITQTHGNVKGAIG
jgi:hypothetical protein